MATIRSSTSRLGVILRVRIMTFVRMKSSVYESITELVNNQLRLNRSHQRLDPSIRITVCGISRMTFGAVSPRPSASNANLVAILTILAASTNPYSRSQKLQTAAVPATISPIPPERLLPPSVLTIYDRLLVSTRSYFPFTKSPKSFKFFQAGIS
jgi:hypothetical protein